LQIKIADGLTAQFVLVSSEGIHIPFSTQGITEANNKATEAASFAISRTDVRCELLPSLHCFFVVERTAAGKPHGIAGLYLLLANLMLNALFY
jgi:hypothetical protein